MAGEAIDKTKSQFHLSGQQRKNDANKEVTDYLNQTDRGYAVQLGDLRLADQFTSFFSERTATVRSNLRSGSHPTLHILMVSLN